MARDARTAVDAVLKLGSQADPRRLALPGALLGIGIASLAVPALALPVALAAVGAAYVACRGTRPDGSTSMFRKRNDGMGEDKVGFHVGNEVGSDREVWLGESQLRQHVLLLGDPTPTRHAFVEAMVANAVLNGSGCALVLHGNAPERQARVRDILAACGREDDLLVLDLTGGVSNTLNPFSTGGADVLTQMVVSLMDDAGGGGDMWKGRATAMFTGVMRALVFLRDSGLLDLNVGEIRDHLNLRRIIDMADKDKYPEMPESIRKTVTSYLGSLPGFQPEKGYKQAQTTLDQHGFLEMQFTRIMGSLADVYGHIFATPYGEVDMFDVVLNRRILMVMLPALGKAKDEVANLGKIIVASLKRMMGATLGSKLEGPWLNVVDQRMTNSPSPFIVILDEVGYYCVEGMDLMAAQARSLGFSMTYVASDLRGMSALNDRVLGSVVGNANTTVITSISDPGTANMAASLVGMPYKPMALSMNEHQYGFFKSYARRERSGAVAERLSGIRLDELGGRMVVVSHDEPVVATPFAPRAARSDGRVSPPVDTVQPPRDVTIDEDDVESGREA